MAKTKLTDTIAADAAPDTVFLRCEDLGQTRDFAPAHAKALLAFQETRGLTGDGAWLPVADAKPE